MRISILVVTIPESRGTADSHLPVCLTCKTALTRLSGPRLNAILQEPRRGPCDDLPTIPSIGFLQRVPRRGFSYKSWERAMDGVAARVRPLISARGRAAEPCRIL